MIGKLRPKIARVSNHLEPLHLRHEDVGDQQVGRIAPDIRDRGAPVLISADRVPAASNARHVTRRMAGSSSITKILACISHAE